MYMASSFMCCFVGGPRWTKQQLREIAEAAFKRQFVDIDIIRINIRQDVGFEDDSPIGQLKRPMRLQRRRRRR